MKSVQFNEKWYSVPRQNTFGEPLANIVPYAPPLKSRSNRPLAMNTDELINILTYYHLQEFSSGRELIQALEEDDYAKSMIAPACGVKRSTFFDTVNERGVEQLLYVFTELQKKAAVALPDQHAELGSLVAIDGSFIDSVLSMHWAEYKSNSNKAKLHLGFNINNGIPSKLFLTDGKGAERPFVETIVDPGQTAILDRGYQAHNLFDQWHYNGCYYVCRIRSNTIKQIITEHPLPEKSNIIFDATVRLGATSANQTKEPVRLVGYEVEDKTYWVATNRFDLTSEQVALAYKLRWNIESFFAWWKRHLNVYHLFARSKNGLMVQILSGLITYLLLAIYCHQQHAEPVSIRRVRQLRNEIRNQAMLMRSMTPKQRKKYRRKMKKEHAII